MIFVFSIAVAILFFCECINIVGEVDEKFFTSAREGDVKLVEAYLEANPTHVSSRDTRGNNAIVIAAGRGRLEVLKVLLKYRANPEDHTNSGLFEGKSALSWAASQGAERFV